MRNDCTVIICARNAGETLRRAVRSCFDQAEVLLIDDHSTDGSTMGIATEFSGLTVFTPPVRIGLGNARAYALGHVRTPWLLWLDADDEFLPGRVDRLVSEASTNGYDLTFDGTVLFDGAKNQFLRDMPIPGFLRSQNGKYLLFMRNFLPGPAWPLVRSDVARKVGFDNSLLAAEDLDFNLRAIMDGYTLGFVDALGYRQYAYSNSLSRDLENQNSNVSYVLRKLEPEDLKKRLSAEFPDESIGGAIYANFLIRMGKFEEAEHELENTISRMRQTIGEILESSRSDLNIAYDGTDLIFQYATLQLINGKLEQAYECFKQIMSHPGRPEIFNNVGIYYRLRGDTSTSTAMFLNALNAFPAYSDAHSNLANPTDRRITLYPIRRHASRFEYY